MINKKKVHNHPEDTFLPMFQKPNRINTNCHQLNTHVIKIWEDISTPNEWAEEIDVISFANENDTIILDICSDGGVLDTAMLFHRALMTTPARTVAMIGPSCASAASIIALSCSEWVIDEISSLMAHTSSYMIGGKDTDILEHASFSRKQLLSFYKTVYTGFLTEEELEDVIKGTPFYFDSEEVRDRLERLAEYRYPEDEDPYGEEDTELAHKYSDLNFLKTLKKHELQEACVNLDIPYTNKDTKAQLIEKLLN